MGGLGRGDQVAKKSSRVRVIRFVSERRSLTVMSLCQPSPSLRAMARDHGSWRVIHLAGDLQRLGEKAVACQLH